MAKVKIKKLLRAKIWANRQDKLAAMGKPSEWNQDVWANINNKTTCGSQACIAGYIVMTEPGYQVELYSDYYSDYQKLVVRDKRGEIVQDYANEAREILGIEYSDRRDIIDELFEPYNSIENINEMIDQIIEKELMPKGLPKVKKE